MKDEAAFPRVFQYWAHDRKGNRAKIAEEHAGMSIRGYFASAALQGILAHETKYIGGESLSKRVGLAWEYANLMLKQYEKEEL